MTHFSEVVYQDFKAHVSQEVYVILGNDALLKCDIPSFVSDLVDIIGWTDNQGNQFLRASQNYGTVAIRITFLWENHSEKKSSS